MKLKESKYDIDFFIRQGWRVYYIEADISENKANRIRDMLKNRHSLEFHIEKETGIGFVKSIKPEAKERSII